MLKNIFLLLRPQQWLKNIFIFIPLFFSRHLLEIHDVGIAAIAFIAYCFMASAIYCFNDILDVESDRKHPQKCKRPLAAGKISKTGGYLLMGTCIALSLAFASLISTRTVLYGLLGVYFVINLAYCLYLKQKAIIDVFIIAVGFVLRVLVGGFTTGIYITHWIVLMTFLLALFLAFAKRRDDVVIYANTTAMMRRNVNRYNLEFMNQVISLIAAITMICYIMYTVSDDVIMRFHSQYIYLTAVWVLAGLIRYLQLTIVDVKSGSPTKVLLKDRFVQACIVGWILHFALFIYL